MTFQQLEENSKIYQDYTARMSTLQWIREATRGGKGIALASEESRRALTHDETNEILVALNHQINLIKERIVKL